MFSHPQHLLRGFGPFTPFTDGSNPASPLSSTRSDIRETIGPAACVRGRTESLRGVAEVVEVIG